MICSKNEISMQSIERNSPLLRYWIDSEQEKSFITFNNMIIERLFFDISCTIKDCDLEHLRIVLNQLFEISNDQEFFFSNDDVDLLIEILNINDELATNLVLMILNRLSMFSYQEITSITSLSLIDILWNYLPNQFAVVTIGNCLHSSVDCAVYVFNLGIIPKVMELYETDDQAYIPWLIQGFCRYNETIEEMKRYIYRIIQSNIITNSKVLYHSARAIYMFCSNRPQYSIEIGNDEHFIYFVQSCISEEKVFIQMIRVIAIISEQDLSFCFNEVILEMFINSLCSMNEKVVSEIIRCLNFCIIADVSKGFESLKQTKILDYFSDHFLEIPFKIKIDIFKLFSTIANRGSTKSILYICKLGYVDMIIEIFSYMDEELTENALNSIEHDIKVGLYCNIPNILNYFLVDSLYSSILSIINSISCKDQAYYILEMIEKLIPNA